ncbi:MAG TPA: Wzz/FepE/Etk N-terminal domain-containing protein [Pyrinomonadaceae bacterium]|nr:Wzz/FepE/Etk N-terminal domain-containing protein [Pyrinomonadaceae bacterium]
MNSRRSGKSETQVSIRDVAGILFRHKLLLCATFLTVVLGTAVITFLMPNEYESRMKILVKNTRSDVPITPQQTLGSTGNFFDSDVSENQINSEIELLTSEDLLKQVVIDCGLYGGGGSSISATLGIKSAPRSKDTQIEEAAKKLAKDLVITPVKKANIIEVKYTSAAPEKAAVVLQKLQDLYLDKHLKLHRPPGTYEFFKTQADQAEGQLQDAEKNLSNFQQAANVVSLTQQKDQTVQKLTESRSKLLETEAFLNEVSERIAKGQQQLEALPSRVVTQSKALPNQYSAERLNTLIVELQNRRTQLLTKFRPEDRLVKEVDQQLKNTRTALDKASKETATEQSTDLNPLRQTLESELARGRVDQAGAVGRHEILLKQVKEYEAQLQRLEGITAQYEDLNRQVRETGDNYQLYKKKEEEARITDALDENKITNVSVAEVPFRPQLPVRPNRPLNLVLGFFLGILLSIGTVVIAEFMRDTVLTPRELEVLTGARVLAALPNTRRDRVTIVSARETATPQTSKPATTAGNRTLSQPKVVRDPLLEWASGE